ncbi:MAG: toxin-antitoxin system YwqK family antitoxin [Bacteroidales bacterium]
MCGIFFIFMALMKTKMRILSLFAILLITGSTVALSQPNDTINRLDKTGKRQGYWMKRHPNGHIQYEGYFKDDRPVKVFKRYYDNDTLQSILFYSDDSRTADAIFFHPNGFIAASGKYINQKKEGKWEFFSSAIKGYKITDEEYSNNMKNGLSVKYYPDKTVAEKIWYRDNVKDGEWIQYHENGKIFLKAQYVRGVLEGPFEVWDASGNLKYKGQYKNDRREGIWYVYNPDGTVKNEIKYINGMATNPELYIRENAILDSLEVTGKNLSDPEKTGTIW